MRNLILVTIAALGFACGTATKNEVKTKEVNIYTHRHYDTDKKIFAEFEKKTGIKVNVVSAKADALIERLKIEGEKSVADILVTSDAGRLVRAKSMNLLQANDDTATLKVVPNYLQDPEGFWTGITKRARVLVYSNERVKAEDLSTYEALTDEKWKGKVLVRSSSNIYNQSLMASIIANNGEEAAKKWAEGIVENMARGPKGNDRDQVKAIASSQGDLALVNTYYIGKLLNSKKEEEVAAGKSVSVFFPNQETTGTHINISGLGLCKYAPNKSEAQELIAYLLSPEVQKQFAEANYEYPVRTDVEPSALLSSWGIFKEDTLNLSILGENNQKAVMTFDKAGWK